MEKLPIFHKSHYTDSRFEVLWVFLFVCSFFFFPSKNSEVFSYFQSYAAEYHEFSQGLLNALFTTEGIVHGIVAHLK